MPILISIPRTAVLHVKGLAGAGVPGVVVDDVQLGVVGPTIHGVLTSTPILLSPVGVHLHYLRVD